MVLALNPIERASRPLLFASSGKDSLALLLLLRPYWHRLVVAWANPGAPHPRTVAHMARVRAMVPHFVELRGRQPQSIREAGWPADVLPVRATALGEVGAGAAPMRFQPYTACCGANMWGPMKEFVDSHDADLVITGQRGDESLRNRLRDTELVDIGGVAYWQPLHAWTERQVLDFIAARGEALPPFYAEGATSSADCWNCTAYLDHNAARLRQMRRDEPERYVVVEAVLSELRRRQRVDGAALDAVLGFEEQGV